MNARLMETTKFGAVVTCGDLESESLSSWFIQEYLHYYFNTILLLLLLYSNNINNRRILRPNNFVARVREYTKMIIYITPLLKDKGPYRTRILYTYIQAHPESLLFHLTLKRGQCCVPANVADTNG